ncbi:hypothetical protein Plec18167_004147 [Paecilomyces lecythidis]|uniref:HNH nuclease domain-containing protein n=1 Tax=Paecilomyces lecythidis TaxID=3004212 RepID=A0ABR3XS71_9EURO
MPPEFRIPLHTSSMAPSDQAPIIFPKLYMSLMSDVHQNSISHKINVRDIRRASAASTNLATSSISQFIDQKAQLIDAEIELLRAYSSGLTNLRATKKIDGIEYNIYFKEIENKKRRLGAENILIKRQRKILEEDINDDVSANIGLGHEFDKIIEITYSSFMTDKMAAARKLSTRGLKHNQSRYRQGVIGYLQAQPHESVVWCHILGRVLPSSSVVVAHLVPESLESEELSYLFGASQLRVSMDKRNGLTLFCTLEKCLDTGQIVIMPIRPEPGDVATRWKCVVIDQEITDNVILAMDETIYFKWVAEVEAKGILWAIPGPYLRRSMLVALARRASDHYVPDVFLDGTFEESKDSPTKSFAEEETLNYVMETILDEKLDSVLEENTTEDIEESEEDGECDTEYDVEE